MKVTGIIWLADILEKLQVKHEVQATEVREVFNNQPHFRYLERGHRKGENVYVALGQTDAGRYLSVFFVHKSDQRALIVSARNMTSAERLQYAKKK